jgi:hypothetical protein
MENGIKGTKYKIHVQLGRRGGEIQIAHFWDRVEPILGTRFHKREYQEKKMVDPPLFFFFPTGFAGEASTPLYM